MSNDMMEAFLVWRGVERPCKKCGGAGSYAYSNTATWMGGVGGQMITTSVCDKCWGSGDEERPWTNLRILSARHRAFMLSLKKIAEGAENPQKLAQEAIDASSTRSR